MDFIGRTEGSEIQMELKYCERCGGLWLRPAGTDGVYCAGCRVCLEAIPKQLEALPRKPRRRKAQLQSAEVHRDAPSDSCRIDYLEGVSAMEVWA
jgi:hypothetical protein